MSKKNGNGQWEENGIPALRIIICGSMTYYHQMQEIQIQMKECGVKSYIPDPDDGFHFDSSPEQMSSIKRALSRAHIKRIRHPETFGILAVNLDKHGIHDYIGANTFAEIAVAFAQGKRIYLLQGIPSMYEDEINAWGGIALFGDLKNMISDYKKTSHRKNIQGWLFKI